MRSLVELGAMNERFRGTVWLLALQFVFMTALVHLAVGLWNWRRWLEAGFLLPADWRWPVFVVSALVLLAGIYRMLYAENRRPYYLAGVLVLLGYAVGYFLWHLIGHPRFLGAGPAAAGEAISLQWFLDHLTAGPIEFFAVVIEVLGAAFLVLLYGTEPTREGASDATETGDHAAGVEANAGGDRTEEDRDESAVRTDRG
jgi:H+/Cl- antiporter ClcA